MGRPRLQTRHDWRNVAYLDASKLHGVGVFAAMDFPKGAHIGTCATVDLGPLHDFLSLPMTGLVVVPPVERGFQSVAHLRAVIGGFPLWYVNYSALPTVTLTTAGCVMALTDVRRGDELTLNHFSQVMR